MDRKQILIVVAVALGVLILDWKTGMIKSLVGKLPVIGSKLTS